MYVQYIMGPTVILPEASRVSGREWKSSNSSNTNKQLFREVQWRSSLSNGLVLSSFLEPAHGKQRQSTMIIEGLASTILTPATLKRVLFRKHWRINFEIDRWQITATVAERSLLDITETNGWIRSVRVRASSFASNQVSFSSLYCLVKWLEYGSACDALLLANNHGCQGLQSAPEWLIQRATRSGAPRGFRMFVYPSLT